MRSSIREKFDWGGEESLQEGGEQALEVGKS